MPDNPPRGLQFGMPVLTLDGDCIGFVQEVRGQFFKIDAPHRHNFWLLREYLLENDGSRVRLAVEKSTLRRYKLGKPRHPRGGSSDDSDTPPSPERADLYRDIYGGR